MRIILRTLLLSLVVTIVSCKAAPLSSKFDKLTDKVEQNYKNWTERDWDRVEDEYEVLLDEYEKAYPTMSASEKEAVNKAIGRYTGLLVKLGVEEAVDAIEDFGEKIPSMVDGFMSAFE